MKQTTLTLGGQERTLDFSRAGLYDHIEDASGEKAFEFLKKLSPKEDEENLFISVSTMSVLVYAGINSHLDVTGEENISFHTVKKWVRAYDRDKLSELYDSVFDGFKTDEPGETKSQEAGQSPGGK